MKRSVIAGVALALALSGCSTLSAIKAVTGVVSPDKPEITAQVGAENTKQGIGVTSKVESTQKALEGDVKGNATVTQATTTNSTQNAARDVTARTVTVTNTNSLQVLGIVGMCLSAVVLMAMYIVRRGRKDEEE
jgi:cobalamin biosynthesis Mg chelatase CobN